MLSFDIWYIQRVDGFVVFIFLCDFIDFQIKDMCLIEDNICSSYFDQFVYLKVLDIGCFCNIIGFVLCVEILQVIFVKLLIYFNVSNVFGI